MSKQWLTDTIYVAASTIDKRGIFTSIPINTGDSIYQVTGQVVEAIYSEEFAKMGRELDWYRQGNLAKP